MFAYYILLLLLWSVYTYGFCVEFFRLSFEKGLSRDVWRRGGYGTIMRDADFMMPKTVKTYITCVAKAHTNLRRVTPLKCTPTCTGEHACSFLCRPYTIRIKTLKGSRSGLSGLYRRQSHKRLLMMVCEETYTHKSRSITHSIYT